MSGPRLITDADVTGGRVPDPIVLGPGVILTPAARDRAVARGMTVVEAEDAAAWRAARASAAGETAPRSVSAATVRSRTTAGCGCGAAAGGCGCGCGQARNAGGCGGSAGSSPAGDGGAVEAALAALPDGVYLVHLRGGRVHDARPVGGGGVGDPSAVRRASSSGADPS